MSVITSQNERSLGFETLSPATATSLNAPSNTDVVLISVDTDDIRWRDDGVDPTASVGNLIQPEQNFRYIGDFQKIRFIGSGNVFVSYYEKI
jgi:hypothetical protein